MTPGERLLAAKLLRRASDSFSNHGCNDYELPDTPENRALVVDVHEGDYEWEWPDDGKPIYEQDWLLMSHLAKKLELAGGAE